MFYIAQKKAIFFGDTKQLKPVFNITHTMEQDLLRSFIKNEDFREKANKYFSCGDYLGDKQYKAEEADKEVRIGAGYDKERFANNVMDIANNATSQIVLLYNPSKLRGDIWLKEHFRCGKPIADIANKMTYNEEMIIKTPHEGSVIWVENVGEKRGTSNEEEIKQIRDYLLRELNELRKRIGASPELDDADFCKKHIGVITPFAEQGRKIKDEFESDKQLSHIKIGTVHTFQGSERDIIVFSTVYGKNAGDPKKFFFNRSETDLLNVAVTRAKKVLIVFGNKNLLGQNGCHSKHLCDAVKQYFLSL
ncbi:DEAD/DEAH box helicase [Helicobacter labetoulli]|uniref:DEAD/DEAH box helicase n=1 Tax=Helicobacter labetoulli TaxID=2315333 RepID=UPI0039E90740